MATIALSPKINGRWNSLKYLDNESKIDLITMLTQSLRTPKRRKKISASKHYGVWGEDGMTTQEFVDGLRNERKFSQEIVEL